ncbi:MAG: bifunctional (p)ppGpp synthetase/guanosine-3',5'-bis(diphosphate) 3'-pyrophosphohydrolase [Candidatus Kerfeldbacteria bacterium]|nr:bifunctional (p)ppGpp synthetase/guanosine-3',5'-bis(diphosphate) 3'-pyrophosphohydrolase [Candidatus Kerfeldbacteria bacterium]
MPTFDELKQLIAQNNPGADLTMLELAYDFAAKAHGGQKRLDGSDYIEHSLATALTLAQMRLDLTTIMAGLLHDIPEDTNITIEEIEKNFGPEIARLVRGITKLGKLKYRGLERYAENLRKMFVAMAEDVRVILIKLADRLHNLSTLSSLPPVKQQRIARETLEIYAPIANRLGIGELKGKLEDLAFRYVYPEEYAWVVKLAKTRLEEQLAHVNAMIKELQQLFQENGLDIVSIHGRAKHYYSLYRKLLRKDMDIAKVYDLVALRIIVKDVAACYHALGLIHARYKPLPGRIKDYIAQPKPNGYRSLHTTVFCDQGRIVEFQIRDIEMHEHAEYGIAAHWRFKENGQPTEIQLPPDQLKWIKELLDWQKDIKDNAQYLQALKIDIFQNRIFVFTPKGDVIDLPENATPIDFAYHIHSDIGDKCSGARVNEKLATLDSKLSSGDLVEIIIDKNRAGPSADWLEFVKTNVAKSHIKNYVKRKRGGLLKFFNRQLE